MRFKWEWFLLDIFLREATRLLGLTKCALSRHCSHTMASCDSDAHDHGQLPSAPSGRTSRSIGKRIS